MPETAVSDAERQRRYRARFKQGAVVVPVELHKKHFDVLTRLGLLSDGETKRPKISQAVLRLIEHWAEKSPLCVTRPPRNSG